MQQELEETLTTIWQAAWDRGELAALESIAAPDYVRVSRASGHTATLAQLQEEIRTIRAGFPDLATTIDAVIKQGDTAAIFWTSTGTHTETFLGVPPTGRRVQTRGSNHVTLEDGRITREEVTWDGSELLHSLGIRHFSDTPLRPDEVVLNDLSGEPDPQVMKTFNRKFITGVTVVTTQRDGTPMGLAVNSYASVSLEPPLVMVCIQKTSSTYSALFAATHLGINILGTDQRETIATFASKTSDKFAEIDWHPGPDGSPLIDNSPASLEAEIKERFQAKTHTVFICRVRHAEVTEACPIIYKAGRFYDGDELTQL